jgi:MFS family permease
MGAAMVNRIHFAFLNLGHLYDHLFMLVFATAAALSLAQEWGMSYAELIPYATPGFVAFGVFSLPAGWIADRWSRKGMMVIFFIGIGLSAILTSLASSPVQIGMGIFFIGVFASIYHPVGLALVVQGRDKSGIPLAINGIFGNMGVACAALITGFFIDYTGWRSAFIWPGIISIATGVIYAGFLRLGIGEGIEKVQKGAEAEKIRDNELLNRRLIIRVFVIIFVSTAIGGLLFQSTTFALPKIFDERLGELQISATLIGWSAFVVFSIAAFGQLIVGYLVDHFSIRLVFVFVAALQAVFFAVMPGLMGLHACCLRTDSHQRCAHQTHYPKPMAKSRVCLPLHCDVFGYGFVSASYLTDSCPLGI